MAIDFSQVKKIVIPEGEVAKIQINGVTVWENAPVLTSITLSGQTTSLNRGAAFSFGGTVTAHYSNGSTANVTSSTTFSGYNMSKAGTYTVTASYTENNVTKTATYQLTVNKIWSTLWSGSKVIKCDGNGTISGTSSNFASTANGTGTSPRIRVTFAFKKSTNGSPTIKYYNGSNTAGTTQPTSPRDFNTIASTNNLNVLGTYYYYKGYPYENTANIWLRKANDTTNNRIRFSLGGSNTGGGWSYTSNYIQLTVTKIEQYY